MGGACMGEMRNACRILAAKDDIVIIIGCLARVLFTMTFIAHKLFNN